MNFNKIYKEKIIKVIIIIIINKIYKIKIFKIIIMMKVKLLHKIIKVIILKNINFNYSKFNF